MRGDALPDVPGEVQTRIHRIAHFQLIDHPQRLQVVLESAVLVHQHVQLLLTGVSKGRVAQIVRQRNGFHQVAVQPERRGDAPGNLRHLQRMRQAGAVQIALRDHEHLRLVLQPAEGRGVQDAVPVALELGPIGIGPFVIAAAR